MIPARSVALTADDLRERFAPIYVFAPDADEPGAGRVCGEWFEGVALGQGLAFVDRWGTIMVGDSWVMRIG